MTAAHVAAEWLKMQLWRYARDMSVGELCVWFEVVSMQCRFASWG